MRTYRNRMRLSIVLALTATVGAGAIGGQIARYGEPGGNFWLVYAGLLGICAIAFAATIPWWRKLDDMQKHWHLVSWYWGGMAGGLAVMMALVAATGVHSELSKGSLYTLVGQAVAFLVFFAGWSLRHRGPEA